MTRQLSYSGTPRMSDGSTRPDDYVSELANPVRRMEVFEEMRSSDEAFETALSAREKLITSANWQLATAGDTPREVEIKEFCEDNLYPLLDDILLQLSGALQYGVGLFEPVFAYADAPPVRNISRGKISRSARQFGRLLYLTKIARIRQRTIWTFQISETGDLQLVRQYVYSGSGLARRDIPGPKLIRWTYRQQGDDYWGRPPMRSLYKAWKFRSQLERLNMLGTDRFGVGVPVGVAGESWSDADIQKFFRYLAAWRAGENAGLVIPAGGTLSIEGGDGKVLSSILDWAKWYAVGIAKVYLTQGTELGTTDSGSRALGEVMQEGAEGVSQSDCEHIAAILNERVIVPLVNWNYGPQESYPTFAPSQRVRASGVIGGLVAGWKQQGVIGWSAEDEQWLRDANGMPDIDVQTRQAEMDEEAAAKEAAAEELRARMADGGINPDDPANDPGDDAEDAPKPGQRGKPAALARGSDRAGAVGGDGKRRAPRALALEPGAAPDTRPLPYRTPEYSAWEMAVVKPDVLARDLDVEAARAAGEVQDILRRIDLALMLAVTSLAMKGVAGMAAGLLKLAVSATLERQLRAAMTSAVERARDYGARTVRAEVARQALPAGIGPGPLPTLPAADVSPSERAPVPDPAAQAEAREALLRVEVDRAVGEELDRRVSAARGAARDAIATAGAGGGEQLQAAARQSAETRLQALSPARTRANVEGVVNAGFGGGRNEAALQIVREHPDEIRSKVYSCVMDENSCEECIKWDGAEFPVDWPESPKGVSAPNPRCEGGISRCRCLWILVSDAESTPSAPASKGPAVFPVR